MVRYDRLIRTDRLEQGLMIQNTFDLSNHEVETEDSWFNLGQLSHLFEFYSIDDIGKHFSRFPSKVNKN